MDRKASLVSRTLFVVLSASLIALLYGCMKTPDVPLDESYPTKAAQAPADLAAHAWAPTEWWYYTGHLQDAQGGTYGFELTFFRQRVDVEKKALSPAYTMIGYMGHFAIVDEKTGVYKHWAIGAPQGKKADAAFDHYEVFLDQWSAKGDEKEHHIEASVKDYEITFDLTALKPMVAHGDGGIVAKGEGLANYYLSFTRLGVKGKLVLDGKPLEVTGQAWFDHEFGFMGMTPVNGWDWYSVQLDDDTELMIYGIRREGGAIDPESRACRIDPNAVEECVPYSEISVDVLGHFLSPHTDAVCPAGWRIKIDRWNVDLIMVPTVADQEFYQGGMAYWEGSCKLVGSPAGGKGYVELVGYSPKGPHAKRAEKK
jgi:predicted secreted hydrolase